MYKLFHQAFEKGAERISEMTSISVYDGWRDPGKHNCKSTTSEENSNQTSQTKRERCRINGVGIKSGCLPA